MLLTLHINICVQYNKTTTMLHSILPIFTQPCTSQESSKSGYPHRRLIVVSRFSSVFGNLKTSWLKGRCKFLHTQLIWLSSTMNVVSLLHKTILLMPSRPSLGGSQVLRADIGPPNHPPPQPKSHTHTLLCIHPVVCQKKGWKN